MEILATLLQGLGSSLPDWVKGALAAGLAPFLIGLAVAQIPLLAGRMVGRALDAALAAGDEADDELLLALVKWAEKKMPDPGSGSEKYKLVARRAVALFPFLRLDEVKLAEAIERAVVRMEEEAEKRRSQPPESN